MILGTEAPMFPDHLAIAPTVTSTGEVLAALDDHPVGPWLAIMIDDIDMTQLTSWDLPTYLSACGRVQAWAAAQLTLAVAELSRRRDVECPEAEVALALNEPRGSAARRMWIARRLTKFLPAVMARFRHGLLSQKHVEAVVSATAAVDDPALLEVVQERVLAKAPGKTADELGRHARDVLRKTDPAGAEARAKDARETQSDVWMFPADEDGMAAVGANMPVEDAGIVKAGVDAYAARAKQQGDPRRIGVLRSEGLTRFAADYLTGMTTSGAAPTSGGRPIEIGITVDLHTALGLRQLPGEVPGHGLVPRDAIAELISAESPKLRLLVIDEHTGQLLYRATNAYRPTAEQVAQVRATYLRSAGPGSQVPAERCDIDHAIPHPEGETVIGNLVPLDRPWHCDKTHTSLSVTIGDKGTITVTTPLGQSQTVEPYDYRVAKPASPPTSPRPPIADDEPPPF